MSYSPADGTRALQRGIGSMIRRAVNRVLKPITRWVNQLLDLVKAPFQVLKRVVQATPKLLTPDLPSLSRVVDLLLELLRRSIMALLVLPRAVFYLSRDALRITLGWLGQNFPTASWRRVDNVMGKHWVVGTGGLIEGLRFVAPGMVQLAVPQPGLSFKGTLGCYHGYVVGHYCYRIIGPFVSGVIATIVVAPEWLIRLAADTPALLVDLARSVLDWTSWGAEELAAEVGDILVDCLGGLATELTRPIRYYGRLVDWIFRPLMDIF